jgi:hypothetical protein
MGGMAHVDNVLSTLGELGVSLSAEVDTHSGTRHTLADVLEDSLRRWRPDRESEWSMIAYCDYLLAQREWEDSENQHRNVDDILATVLNRNTPGPCFGTHRYYALAKACKRSRATPGFFSHDLIRQAEQELTSVSNQLSQSQHPSGYWDPESIGKGSLMWSPDVSSKDRRLRLVVTGHMLEWFAIADKDLRPSTAVISRAAGFIESELRTNPEAYYDSSFLPAATHAIRALFHLSGTTGCPPTPLELKE